MLKISLRAFTKWLIIIKIFTVTALIFGIASAVQAGGKLVTPAVLAFGTNHAVCSVLNAGSNPVIVQITLINNNAVLQDSVTWDIPPNNSRTLSQALIVPEWLHCVIDIIEGKKQNLRGTLSLFDSGASDFRDSVEAR
jgi:hypothetical protein